MISNFDRFQLEGGMRQRLSTYLVVAYTAALAVGACAPAGAPGGGLSDTNSIGRSEFAQAGLQNASALQIVQRLRPRWLDPHPVYGLSRVRVVIDDVFVGGLDALRGVNSATISGMTYMTPSEAKGILALSRVPVDAAIVVRSDR